MLYQRNCTRRNELFRFFALRVAHFNVFELSKASGTSFFYSIGQIYQRNIYQVSIF